MAYLLRTLEAHTETSRAMRANTLTMPMEVSPTLNHVRAVGSTAKKSGRTAAVVHGRGAEQLA